MQCFRLFNSRNAGEVVWFSAPELMNGFLMVADSLSFTSGLSVGLAVAFLVITVGITVIKLISGGISMPRLLPDVTDLTSFWKLFTVVPILVTAYICHYNGK